MKAYGKGEGHAWLGRLLVAWPLRLGEGHPLVDGSMTILTEVDDETGLEERTGYGGLAFRVPFGRTGVGVGWRGARIMNPYRWRPGAVWMRVKWNLAGRPAPQPMAAAGTSHPDWPRVDAAHVEPRQP